jgi:hypothetical protein
MNRPCGFFRAREQAFDWRLIGASRLTFRFHHLSLVENTFNVEVLTESGFTGYSFSQGMIKDGFPRDQRRQAEARCGWPGFTAASQTQGAINNYTYLFLLSVCMNELTLS